MTKLILKHPWFLSLLLRVVLIGSVAMYIWVTPFSSSRGSSFWILTWWPVNAVIIGFLYDMQFPLLLRLLSIKQIYQQYKILKQRSKRENSIYNTVEKL